MNKTIIILMVLLLLILIVACTQNPTIPIDAQAMPNQYVGSGCNV